MKRILLISFLAFGSFYSYADSPLDNQKIATVKYLYDKELAPIESGFRMKVTPELRSLLIRDDKGTKRAAGGYMDLELSCQGSWFPQIEDYDDPNFVPIKSSARYRVVQNGNVRVAFTNANGDEKIIHYQMACKNNKCLVDDIIGNTGTSYKKKIRQCLKDKRY